MKWARLPSNRSPPAPFSACRLEKRLTPHGLRHTFASLLLADGIPVPEVSTYLGHKDCSVTLKIYAHFVREETHAMHNLAASILLTAGQA